MGRTTYKSSESLRNLVSLWKKYMQETFMSAVQPLIKECTTDVFIISKMPNVNSRWSVFVHVVCLFKIPPPYKLHIFLSLFFFTWPN